MQLTTRVLVLHAFKYGEAQLIVDMLSADMGRLTFLVPVPRSGRSKRSAQWYQPLTFLDVTFDHRATAKFQKVKEVHACRPYTSIPFHPLKLPMTLFLAEFLVHATRGEQGDDLLFAFIESSLNWFDEAQSGFVNFHLVFMMRLTRFLGFFPNAEKWREGCVFDLQNAEFTPVAPLHSHYIPAQTAPMLRLLLRLNYETMHRFTFSREERNQCIDYILQYYRLHVSHFPELRSLPVVQALFD